MKIEHIAIWTQDLEWLKDYYVTYTDALFSAGYPILSEPRTTGDGYYESVTADPEGNLIEITI